MGLTTLQTASMIVSISYVAGMFIYTLVSMNILKNEFKRGAIDEDKLIDGYVTICIVLSWFWPISMFIVELKEK